MNQLKILVWTMELQTEPLAKLLSSPSKAAVDEFFIASFQTRNLITLPNALCKKLATALSLEESEILQVLSQHFIVTSFQTVVAARSLVSHCLYNNLSQDGVRSCFPPGFHPQLATLISTIIAFHSAEWREELIKSQVSVPQLVESDWRLDIKAASSTMAQMAVPSAVIDLKVLWFAMH